MERKDRPMETDSLMPCARVCVYDWDFDAKRHGKSRDRYFATLEDAKSWIQKVGARVATIYRIEKVNGTWRSDWKLR